MRTMLATVVRGLRSRGLLSVGSVLLTTLAIGSAVLGPIFQVAVTNSYLVTRLNQAPNQLTGLSWDFTPDNNLGADRAQMAAGAAVAGIDGPFTTPQTVLETSMVEAYGGRWRLSAKDDACAHLEIEGSCPTKPGQALMLAGDLDFSGSKVGQTIDFAGLGKQRIVGTYRVPGAEQEDFWFDLSRFESIPPHDNGRTVTPYKPAPLVTVPGAFDDLSQQLWQVRVDRRLAVPSDLTLPVIEGAEQMAAGLDGSTTRTSSGLLKGNSINDLSTIVSETRAQQTTARSSIAPAVLSLVLVALALLLRLLMAAADLRLPELALASLRGLGRRKMWSLGLSEPVVLLLASIPVGAVVGIGLSLGLVRWWLVPGLPLPLPWLAVATGLGVAVAALGVAVLAVGLVLRVSLSEQLTGVRRPKRSSRIAVVAQLVLVAGALAVLASKLSVKEPGDPDATDLVLPVLLAVVAGLAATRGTVLLASWWTRRRRRGRSLPAFVAARAISRRQEGTLVILPVTAAIAICVFGAGVYTSAAQWRESVAATAAPAQVVWRSPLTIDQTVDLTHKIDPDGQYLMAAGTLVTQGPTFTIVDTPRLSRVAAWQDQWTPGLSTQQITDDLVVQADVPTVTGTRVGLTVDNRSDADGGLFVRLRLDAEGTRIHYAFVGPFGPGVHSRTAPARYCGDGCAVQAITIGGPASLPVAINGTVTLSDLVADDKPVPGAIDGAGWARAPDASAGAALTDVTGQDGKLKVDLASGDTPIIAQLTSGAIPEALPVLKGVDATTRARGGAASETSASTFPVDPVASTQSVPLLGPIGLMIDYGMITSDRDIYEQQDATILVLARSDTPVAMQQDLQSAGVSVQTTLTQVQGTLDQSAYALALRLYAVVAVLVLLMALAGLFVSTAVQLPARRRDAASLRVVGVPRRSVMSAVLRELVFVLGGTAVAGLAAGTLAQYVVLRTVTLGYVESITTPALIAAVDWGRLALLSGVAALLFGAVALGSALLTVRGARGSTLRETGR